MVKRSALLYTRGWLGSQRPGGEARIGINSQGEEGPDLRNENGGILNYDIGEGLAQQYISARIFL